MYFEIPSTRSSNKWNVDRSYGSMPRPRSPPLAPLSPRALVPLVLLACDIDMTTHRINVASVLEASLQLFFFKLMAGLGVVLLACMLVGHASCVSDATWEISLLIRGPNAAVSMVQDVLCACDLSNHDLSQLAHDLLTQARDVITMHADEQTSSFEPSQSSSSLAILAPSAWEAPDLLEAPDWEHYGSAGGPPMVPIPLSFPPPPAPTPPRTPPPAMRTVTPRPPSEPPTSIAHGQPMPVRVRPVPKSFLPHPWHRRRPYGPYISS